MGIQLEAGTSQQSDAVLTAHRQFVARIGWTARDVCVGFIHFPPKAATFTDPTGHPVRNAIHRNIRLESLEFDLPAKFEASEKMIEWLSTLMYAKDSCDHPVAAVHGRQSIHG
jgi:hypothetical protein